MRPIEGETEEKGSGRVPLAQEIARPADKPGLLHKVFGQMVRPSHPGIAIHPVGKLFYIDPRLLGQPLRVVLRGDQLLKSQVKSSRIEVRFADVDGLIAGPG